MLSFGCGKSDDAVESREPLLVLAAFPAERAALLERATIDQTVQIEGHVFRIGTLASSPVIIAMTGIGLVNATTTTRIALARFAVSGVVMSGVAGSPSRIGDVVVPSSWTLPDGSAYPVDTEWLEIARAVAGDAQVALERCTTVTMPMEAGFVCLAYEPVIAVGGVGRSSDPFGGGPLPCQPDGGDVFGCDTLDEPAGFGIAGAGDSIAGEFAGSETPIAEDMETAAVAREAASVGVPFIAFRAVSDGTGDPLNLPGFPAQFFAYYPLAAENAAAATAAFLERRSR